MTKKNDGGPAFPRTGDTVASRFKDFDLNGMSLRDYFAAKAMQSLALSCTGGLGMTEAGEDALKEYAADAYRWADAMLEVRDE